MVTSAAASPAETAPTAARGTRATPALRRAGSCAPRARPGGRPGCPGGEAGGLTAAGTAAVRALMLRPDRSAEVIELADGSEQATPVGPVPAHRLPVRRGGPARTGCVHVAR